MSVRAGMPFTKRPLPRLPAPQLPFTMPLRWQTATPLQTASPSIPSPYPGSAAATPVLPVRGSEDAAGAHARLHRRSSRGDSAQAFAAQPVATGADGMLEPSALAQQRLRWRPQLGDGSQGSSSPPAAESVAGRAGWLPGPVRAVARHASFPVRSAARLASLPVRCFSITSLGAGGNDHLSHGSLVCMIITPLLSTGVRLSWQSSTAALASNAMYYRMQPPHQWRQSGSIWPRRPEQASRSWQSLWTAAQMGRWTPARYFRSQAVAAMSSRQAAAARRESGYSLSFIACRRTGEQSSKTTPITAMQPALCCRTLTYVGLACFCQNGCVPHMHFASPCRRRLLNVCRQSLGPRRLDQLSDNQHDFPEPLIPSSTLRRALSGDEQAALLPAEQPLHRCVELTSSCPLNFSPASRAPCKPAVTLSVCSLTVHRRRLQAGLGAGFRASGRVARGRRRGDAQRVR